MCFSLTVSISDSIDSAVRLVNYTLFSFEDIILTIDELYFQFYVHAFSLIRVPISVDDKEENSCPAENM